MISNYKINELIQKETTKPMWLSGNQSSEGPLSNSLTLLVHPLLWFEPISTPLFFQ